MKKKRSAEEVVREAICGHKDHPSCIYEERAERVVRALKRAGYLKEKKG